MKPIRLFIAKACEPDEDILALPNGQGRECIWAVLRHKICEDLRASHDQCRLDSIFKIADEVGFNRRVEIIDRSGHKPIADCAATYRWTMLIFECKPGRWMGGTQQQDVIRVDHRRVGRIAM